MLKTIVVKSKLGSVIFSCFIHKRDQVAQLALDPEEFYKKWSISHDLPEMPHYEIQLLQTWRIRQHTSDVGRPVMLHIYKGKDSNEYMCYTPTIPSEENAVLIWKAWCVGTIYAILRFIRGIEDYDFDGLFKEYDGNYEGLIKFLAENEDINILT